MDNDYRSAEAEHRELTTVSVLCGVSLCVFLSTLPDHLELQTFPMLQEPCYHEHVIGCRIASWPEHAFETRVFLAHQLAKRLKADR